MTTYTFRTAQPIRLLPTRRELKDVLARVEIMIAMVIGVFILAETALIGVIYLAATGHEAAVVGAFVGGPLVALLAVLAGRWSTGRAHGGEIDSGRLPPP